jgi:hypothetical protein
MVLHWGTQSKCTIHALLDTGCSTPLISKKLVKEKTLPVIQRKNPVALYNFTGELVTGAGDQYTQPMLLQHRRHYTQETFEVTPLEPGVDVFLPFWWIEKHPPQGAWNSTELRFSSHLCLTNCTKTAVQDFSLSLDETVLADPQAKFLGYVSAVEIPTEGNPLETVPKEFRQFLSIMGKEAADALPEHTVYDMKIDLKEGTTAPWGPIYPLSEAELEVLREYLKEML